MKHFFYSLNAKKNSMMISLCVLSFLMLQPAIMFGETWTGSYAAESWKSVCYDAVRGGLVAATNKQAYASSDGGVTWNSIVFPDDLIEGMVSTHGVLVALSVNGDLYKTSNLGATWASVDNGQLSRVYSFSVNDSGCYLANTSEGLMYSDDGGSSWAEVGEVALSGHSVQDVHVDVQGNLLVSVYNMKVFRSLDGGVSWSESSGTFDSTPDSLASSPDGTLFVGTYWNGVLKSVDHGASWTSCSSGLPGGRGVKQVGVVSDTNLYALVSDQQGTVGLFVSSDGGASWSSAMAELPVSQQRASLYAAGSPSAYWIAQGIFGVGTTQDGGESWGGFDEMVPQGVVAMAPSSRDVLFVGCNDGGSGSPNAQAVGVFGTADNAATWVDLNDGFGSYDFAVQDMVRADDDTIIVLPYTPGQILLRAATGDAWLHKDSGLWSTFATATRAADGSLLLGNVWAGPIVSTDNGRNWTVLPGWPNMTRSSMVGKDSAGRYFAVRGNLGLYRSDGDDVWESVGFCGVAITALLVRANDDVLVATSNGIYRSQDSGVTWNDFMNGLPEMTGAYDILETCDGSLYLAGRGATYDVFKYREGGTSWESMSFPLNGDVTRVYSLAFMKGKIYAGTNNGVFHTDVNVCEEYPLLKSINMSPINLLLIE